MKDSEIKVLAFVTVMIIQIIIYAAAIIWVWQK
jgi:hypothetical protein